LATTKIFVDTGYVIALINQRDQYHRQALRLVDEYEGQPLLTTDSILLEIGNALTRGYKEQTIEIIEDFTSSDDIEIVRLTPSLFDQAFALYRSHQDKEWTIVDCISFVVMRQAGVTEALTTDKHFKQAGFRALLRE
jgi:uncharacterized protein